jgi:hypothetical protein
LTLSLARVDGVNTMKVDASAVTDSKKRFIETPFLAKQPERTIMRPQTESLKSLSNRAVPAHATAAPKGLGIRLRLSFGWSTTGGLLLH